jgi:hypothetical protein
MTDIPYKTAIELVEEQQREENAAVQDLAYVLERGGAQTLARYLLTLLHRIQVLEAKGK